MHLRRTVIVARDEAKQNLGKEAPLFRPQPPHDPEVDGDQAFVVIDEQIARVHVGVKKTVAQSVA
jgi:hypothetical protein